jgi:HD-GYP domain-containing protein (c-di-GMP phosphodiesterase class II)
VYVPLEKARPGMRLARPVFDAQGNVLLKAGVVLDEAYISRLKRRGSLLLFIHTGLIEREVEEAIPAAVRARIERKLAGLLSPESKEDPLFASHEEARTVAGRVREYAGEDGTVDCEWRRYEPGAAAHALNVAVLAAAVGVRLNWSATDLHNLTTCALLHDVGLRHPKVARDPTWRNPHWWQHAAEGSRILFGTPAAAFAALQHHERLDGTGFPKGLKGREISEYAQIIGLCDAWDCLVSGFGGVPQFGYDEAADLVAALAGRWFAHEHVRAFFDALAAWPPGTVVELTGGETAVVLETPPGQPTRPRVRILLRADGSPDGATERELEPRERVRRQLDVAEVEEVRKRLCGERMTA